MVLDREAVINALYDAGLGDDEDVLREDYSGRFMYGAECLGIVHAPHGGDIGKFYIYLAQYLDADVACELADAARTDSMGLDTITYWPGVTLEAEATVEPGSWQK